jgi:4-hydroxy-tetrahydrodipicolinate synthase
MIYDVITVIPTFFDSNNEIDMVSIKKHIDYQINNGIQTIVILGTTSETPTLTQKEKILIVENICNEYRNKLSIIIGVSGNDTESVLEEAKLYETYGNAIMISAPYYNKPSQEGLYQHFYKIISTIKNKFILYNVPSRSGVNIEPTTISRLYNDFPFKITAIKEASGSIEQVMKIKSLCKIKILSGDDALVLPFMSVGAEGVISVVSNVVPSEMLLMVSHFKEGNLMESNKIFYELYDLIKLCFIESNPVPVKYILSKTMNSLPNVRLPLVGLENKNKDLFEKFLDNL